MLLDSNRYAKRPTQALLGDDEVRRRSIHLLTHAMQVGCAWQHQRLVAALPDLIAVYLDEYELMKAEDEGHDAA